MPGSLLLHDSEEVSHLLVVSAEMVFLLQVRQAFLSKKFEFQVGISKFTVSFRYSFMEIADSRKAYKAPKADVVVINVQGVLCNSPAGSIFSLTDDQVEKGGDEVYGAPTGW